MTRTATNVTDAPENKSLPQGSTSPEVDEQIARFYGLAHADMRDSYVRQRAKPLLSLAVRQNRSAASIREAISSAIGYEVSNRTIARWISATRREMGMERIVQQRALAISACEGDMQAMSRLAASIDLDPDWKSRRSHEVERATRKLLDDPSPQTLQSLRVQSLLYVFESEFARYTEKGMPPQ